MISSVGVVNGFALSGYLLLKKPRTSKQIILAFLIFALSIRIAKSVFLFFNPGLERPFLQLGLMACFFIGPLCLAFLAIDKERMRPFLRFWPLYLASLAAISLAWILFFPYQPHGFEWTLAVQVIYFEWLACLCLATVMVLWAAVHQRTVSLLLDIDPLDAGVLIGCWIIWAAYFFSTYTSYLAGALSFTFIISVSILTVLPRGKLTSVAYKAPYQGTKISSDDAHVTKTALEHLMEQELIFQDPNLTLPRVAKRLGVSPQRLSQILNDNMQISFTNYVNRYRVENAKKLLCEDKRLSMDDIIEACGFNTQSTFYKAFKTLTKTTPAKFRMANKD